MTKVWFEDPRQLIRQDKISQFWPNNKQTPAERVNSASRFIIYTIFFIFNSQGREYLYSVRLVWRSLCYVQE